MPTPPPAPEEKGKTLERELETALVFWNLTKPLVDQDEPTINFIHSVLFP